MASFKDNGDRSASWKIGSTTKRMTLPRHVSTDDYAQVMGALQRVVENFVDDQDNHRLPARQQSDIIKNQLYKTCPVARPPHATTRRPATVRRHATRCPELGSSGTVLIVVIIAFISMHMSGEAAPMWGTMKYLLGILAHGVANWLSK